MFSSALNVLEPFNAHCCHMGTVKKHSVPDRVKLSMVIFWHPGTLMLSCTHIATVGVEPETWSWCTQQRAPLSVIMWQLCLKLIDINDNYYWSTLKLATVSANNCSRLCQLSTGEIWNTQASWQKGRAILRICSFHLVFFRTNLIHAR